MIESVEYGFFAANKPNYKNTIEKNYCNGRLVSKVEKGNVIKDNILVKGKNWPATAKAIMKNAGPRAPFRYPQSAAEK